VKSLAAGSTAELAASQQYGFGRWAGSIVAAECWQQLVWLQKAASQQYGFQQYGYGRLRGYSRLAPNNMASAV
jgi:hypothetical protein